MYKTTIIKNTRYFLQIHFILSSTSNDTVRKQPVPIPKESNFVDEKYQK